MRRALSGMRALMLIFAALLMGTSSVLAQDGSDTQSDGKFTGIAIITGDVKWFDLFAKPETPHIQGQDKFGPGERGALAIIFSNAKPRGGIVKVECDIIAYDPEGTKPVVKSGKCYEGPYYGDNILHPALLEIQFEGDKDDPAGRAGFEITLRDVYSGRSVKLSVAYEQVTK